jgi:hypothetical protein
MSVIDDRALPYLCSFRVCTQDLNARALSETDMSATCLKL